MLQHASLAKSVLIASDPAGGTNYNVPLVCCRNKVSDIRVLYVAQLSAVDNTVVVELQQKLARAETVIHAASQRALNHASAYGLLQASNQVNILCNSPATKS